MFLAKNSSSTPSNTASQKIPADTNIEISHLEQAGYAKCATVQPSKSGGDEIEI